MEHNFTGPKYTVGIEEELMILDPQSLDLKSGVNLIVGESPPLGEIKPELLESVVEISTSPCKDIPAAGAELVALRRLARDRAHKAGLEIGASGTHPFARWEDQRVVNDDRYHGLIRQL